MASQSLAVQRIKCAVCHTRCDNVKLRAFEIRLRTQGRDWNAALLEETAINFRDNAPMTAAAAATVILDGVRAERWRILVGDDAHALDHKVRASPENAYDPDFLPEGGVLAAAAGPPTTPQE